MRPARRLALAALLLPVAGGCSLFEPVDVLAYETLLHSPAALTGLSTPVPFGHLLQSEVEEGWFVERYGLAMSLPEVDHGTHFVVGLMDGPLGEDASVTITRVEADAGRLRVEGVRTGRRPEPGTPGAFPVHLVAVPRTGGEVSLRQVALQTIP